MFTSRLQQPGGYNISSTADAFHLLPRLKFTLPDGLSLMSNRTLDLERADYVNSLCVSLALPLVVLLVLLVLYTFQIYRLKRTVSCEKLPTSFFKPPPPAWQWSMGLAMFVVLVVVLVTITTATTLLAQTLLRHENNTCRSIERVIQMKAKYETIDQTLEHFDILPTNLFDNTIGFARNNLRQFFNVFFTERHQQMLLRAQDAIRVRNRFVVTINYINATILSLFIVASFAMLIVGRLRLEMTKLSMLALLALTSSMVAFAINLSNLLGSSDFCVDAQQHLYHIIQHRVYENNPTTRDVVNYYIFCDRANWQEMEQNVWNVIDAVNDYAIFGWIDLSHLKSPMARLLRLVSCTEMHSKMITGLELLCNIPIDMLAVLVFANLGTLLIVSIFLVYVVFYLHAYTFG